MCGAFGGHIRQPPNAPLVVRKRLCPTHSAITTRRYTL